MCIIFLLVFDIQHGNNSRYEYRYALNFIIYFVIIFFVFNPLNPELNPICYFWHY